MQVPVWFYSMYWTYESVGNSLTDYCLFIKYEANAPSAATATTFNNGFEILDPTTSLASLLDLILAAAFAPSLTEDCLGFLGFGGRVGFGLIVSICYYSSVSKIPAGSLTPANTSSMILSKLNDCTVVSAAANNISSETC